MATDFGTIEFLMEQIHGTGIVTYKKMFGEYIIYVNAKPVFLVCDDTLYIKQLDSVKDMLMQCPTAPPYSGAKDHYVIEDIDNREFLSRLALALEKVVPVPAPRKKKRG